jgi:TPR repeat protein
MRIDSAVTFIFLWAGLAATPAISQDAAGPGARNSHPAIISVSVAERADSVDVEVTFSELVQPEVSRLEHPDRLVFDFRGCELAGPGQHFVVNRGPVLAVSTAALGVASPVARVVIELRSAQSRERAIAGNKLVVNLSSTRNNLIIELGANGGTQRSAPASGGNKPAVNGQPLAPKSTEVVPPMPSAPPVVLGANRVAPKSAEVVPPMPSAPPVVLGANRAAPESVEVVRPMPSVPPLVLKSDRAESKSVEVVPPIPSAPPLVLKSDHAESRSAEAVAPTPTIPLPPQIARTATVQFHAYALLDKARALTVPDLEPLEARAEAGDPEAETTLALAYHAGTLLKMDDEEALRLLQHAANRGFVAAEEAMGIFCQSGFGMPPNKAQAVSWYTKAAQHGSIDAATNLALMYSTGDGIPKDAVKAATWFRSAAEAGDATAQLNLAALYHRGEGVPQDDAQSVLWLTKAAGQDFLPAMLELAKWDLQHGHNVDAAIIWYKKAADRGNASAQVALGDIFADQKLGRLDYSQAVDWYRKAADQNQTGGEFGLGARYLLGQGVSQNLGEARRWLTPAANRGHPYAQFLLAKMFEAGEGGPVDATSAAKYYEPAANYGIAEAQYRFGLLLASDRGNGVNLVSAYKWLVLAQDGVKESATTAQEIQKLLTPAQLAQAEHEIDEWRTANFPRHSGR